MKVFVSLLILMSLLIPEAVAHNYKSAVPTNIDVIPGDKKITLRWTHPEPPDLDSSKYGFQWANQEIFHFSWRTPTQTAFSQNPHYISTGLTNGQSYTYRIRYSSHQDDYDHFSEYSIPLTVIPKIPSPTNFRATAGDGEVTLSWTAPSSGITGYQYSQDGGTWTSTGSTGTSYSVSGLENGDSYTFRIRATRTGETADTSSQISRTVTVTPLGPAPGAPGTLSIQRVEDTAILTWSPPSNTETPIRYEYSDDEGSTWTSTGSIDTTYTVTGLEPGETYTFLVRAVYVREGGNRQYVYISHRSRSSNAAVLTFPISKRRIIQECPVGWVRSDGFAGRNRRVLLYEFKVEMDLHNRVSIYKPVWVAIYVHPDEGLENLEGWKLQVALPYNHHREYLLTAENSVVVDAGFVEGGFAFIENPEEDPFPMVGVGFMGSPAPGFDYRLYDETGRRVDFGISCYKRGDIFQVLKDMEDPRVLRNVLLETLNWDAHFLRSEWTVPVPVNGFPGAPSLHGVNLVGKWGDLKKQSISE